MHMANRHVAKPLSGGAFFMGKKSPRWETRAARNKQQNVK
ncbi:hypothetical protein AD03_0729 [Escherichia coli 2-474-04_S4_C2]|nr:hypothetical protein AKN41_1219 [Escherichia coli]KDZ08897.1 hypothetical protein AD03_0729 [Escherichia coli 2-474-04_S4_C2]KDZ14545.1 hypothetical protein AD33_1269 [Escherichia coli 2-474-04_S4_C3]KEN86557.1 hypothetical protein AC75_1431 [Escherichia coli 2-474-04_S4_C1]